MATERVRRAPEPNARLPAGLDDAGRDEELAHGPEAHPSGARGDHRHSVPGTMIPGAPHPAEAAGERERMGSAEPQDEDQG
jgi:hypothetical protein